MSIIAVFLALALGIVVGTTALNGEVLNNLRGSIRTLTGDKRGLEGTVSALRDELGSSNDWADRVAPAAVSGQLEGRRVVVVVAPDAAAALADDLTPLLLASGASVSGVVQLRPDLLDPAAAATVEGVVGRVAPAGLDLPVGEPTVRAAAELAAALVQSGTAEVSVSEAEAVVEGFRSADLVDLPGPLGARADLAVVVAGGPVSSPAPAVPQERARALLQFVSALDGTGSGTVLAGPLAATGPGGALGELRGGGGGLSERVSSVDGLDGPRGQVATVYALREQQDGGSGRYGTGPGTQGPLPALPVR